MGFTTPSANAGIPFASLHGGGMQPRLEKLTCCKVLSLQCARLRQQRLQGFVAAECMFATAATTGEVDMLQGFIAAMCVFAAAATTGKVG